MENSINMKYNFDNKTFILIDNSNNGTVSNEAVFRYKQIDNLVTADYSGGTIKHGRIIAKLVDDHLEMLYHCLTTDDVLKAGSAIAQITLSESNKMKLQLNWRWLTGDLSSGTSEYIEI